MNIVMFSQTGFGQKKHIQTAQREKNLIKAYSVRYFTCILGRKVHVLELKVFTEMWQSVNYLTLRKQEDVMITIR